MEMFFFTVLNYDYVVELDVLIRMHTEFAGAS